MDVHFGGVVLRIEPQSPSHFGQGGQQTAIHGGEAAQGFRFLALEQRPRLRGELADEFVEQFGIEDPAGFAEGAPGDAFTAEQALHFVQFGGLLNAA